MPQTLRSTFRAQLEKHAPAVAKAAGKRRPTNAALEEWWTLLKAPTVTLAQIEQVRWRPAQGWSDAVGESLQPLLGKLDTARAFRLGLLTGVLRLERLNTGVRDYSAYHHLLRHWTKVREGIVRVDLDPLRAELASLELEDPYAEYALTYSLFDGKQPPLAEIKQRSAAYKRRMAGAKLTPPERAAKLNERFAREPTSVLAIAPLHVGSGAIVACDPQGMLDEEPFIRRVPKGDYPVELLTEGRGKRRSVAAARVVLGAGRAVRWEVARPRGRDLDRSGYPVDSALGCFVDAATLRALTRRMSRLAQPDEDAERAAFLGALRKNGGVWAEQRPDPDQPGNLVAFSTGMGDGMYLSCWGLDAQRRPVVLLTNLDTWP